MRPRMLAVAVIAAAIVAGCGDTQDPTVPDSPPETPVVTTTPRPSQPSSVTTAEAAGERIEITVSGGQVQGPGSVAVDAGTEVELLVTSDVADHIHVHGYDLLQDVAAGETVSLSFTADLPGTWEVELEDSGTHLLELQVQG